MTRSSRTTLLTTALTLAIMLPAVALADDSFVPLTSLPGLNSVLGSPSTPAFINNLYRILIGVSAFLAIAMFIYAGIKIMNNTGNVAQNKEARGIIANAIFGLILVLSPAVVFGVINPKILDISLDFGALKSNTSGADVQNGGLYANGSTSSQVNPDVAAKYCAVYQDPTNHNVQLKSAILKNNQSCSDALGAGWSGVGGCCANLPAGATCCGYNANDVKQPDTGNTLGKFSYSIIYQSRDDITGKMCRATDDESFDTSGACLSAFTGATSASRAIGGLFAVAKTCDEKGVHTPTPSGNNTKLNALPACPK